MIDRWRGDLCRHELLQRSRRMIDVDWRWHPTRSINFLSVCEQACFFLHGSICYASTSSKSSMEELFSSWYSSELSIYIIPTTRRYPVGHHFWGECSWLVLLSSAAVDRRVSTTARSWFFQYNGIMQLVYLFDIAKARLIICTIPSIIRATTLSSSLIDIMQRKVFE